MTKLDWLARSRPDARDIVAELTEVGVTLSIGGSVHDPNDPVGRLLFNVLAMTAKFESDLIRMRTREGMKVVKAKGRLRGEQPQLKPTREKHLVELWHAGRRHVFVDESKQRDYLLVAAVIMPTDLTSARRTIRALVMPGQRRLHMKKESDTRRAAIVDAIASTGASATIYDAGIAGCRELVAREACLRAVITDVASAGHHLLVIEQDDSLLWWDQQRLIDNHPRRRLPRDPALRASPCRAGTAIGRTRRDRLVLGQERFVARPCAADRE